MQTTFYTIPGRVDRRVRIALVSDLHDRPAEPVLSAICRIRPDYIAVTGDCLDGHRRALYARQTDDTRNVMHLYPNAMRLLRGAPAIAPTFYSLGNHEWFLLPPDIAQIAKTGSVLLDNDAVRTPDGLLFGGLTPANVLGFRRHLRQSGARATQGELRHAWRTDSGEDDFDMAWLDSFERQRGPKVLLCHHPECWAMLAPQLQQRRIDLVLCGHAHGGQIRLFGRGLFSSSQGFFPRYTDGVFTGAHGSMVISRGLANTVLLPRIGNPTQLVCVDLVPEGAG